MSELDRLFMDRALELAERGVGSTAPNPAVGCVIVRDGRVLGEGYHHRAGQAHAEANALAAAGDVSGATAYVTLEPCNHVGRTPACAQSLIRAGVARVVVGTADPNPKTDGGGISALRGAGIRVDVVDDARALRLIEPFAFAVRHERPFVALKMAMSLDGKASAAQGATTAITGEPWRLFVRDLRIAYDAVMVGAGTIRVDDSQLTVRPPSHRLRAYTRVVVCESDTVPGESRVFHDVADYARTIVLAPAGARERFGDLTAVANVLFIGDDGDVQLDLPAAMHALRDAGVQSVLCEGGPTLGARLLAGGLVDRVYWGIAPRFLTAPNAVPVLAGANLATMRDAVRFDRVEMIGEDALLTGRVHV